MPIYEYKCACGHTVDKFLKLEEYDKPQRCECGQYMTKQFSAPMVRGDYPPYECPITGRMIEGRAAHRENLARHGCRVLEPGEREQVERHRRQSEIQLDKAVEATADEFIAKLPTRKAEQLVAEIQGGMTAEIVRN